MIPLNNFFKNLNIYLLHIYKGGEETKRDPPSTPSHMPGWPGPSHCRGRHGWKGQDLCCILLNYSECKPGPIYRAETLQVERGVAEQAPESWPEGTSLPPCPPLPRHLLGPAGLLWENRPAHMILAGVKTGPTHKVSVISQPQDRGLHTSSASWSSPGSSCPRSASLRARDER